MPSIEFSASLRVKENQKDVKTAAALDISIKDTMVDDYNGPIRLTIKSGEDNAKKIDLSHLPELGLIMIKVIAGGQFRLAIRRAATDMTNLTIRKFFIADVRSVDQLKITNISEEDLIVQVALVGLRDES